MTTLTKQQWKEIREVQDLYDTEVMADAKQAITGYMASDNKPEDADWTNMRAHDDDAVTGGRNPEEAKRRLEILMQDDDLWNDFAPLRPEEMEPLDADEILRMQAFDRINSELNEWIVATYPELEV